MKQLLKTAIVEDELPAYDRLHKLLHQTTNGKVEVLAHLESVTGTKKWLSDNPSPDVIFMDTSLSDGSIFDLLKKVTIPCPLIFTTSSNHIPEAFKLDDLNYLLKPIKEIDLKNVLAKLSFFANLFQNSKVINFKSENYKKRFLVRYGKHIMALEVKDIAYFVSAQKASFAHTFSGQTFPIDAHLDLLESMLNPMDFFRINRKYIAHIHAIEHMQVYSKGRVFLSLKHTKDNEIVVSSEKSPRFKRWLDGEI